MEGPDRRSAARRLGVTLSDAQWAALERYAELLLQWNAHFNLISRRDVSRLWSRHILDSLSIQPLLAALRAESGVERLRAVDVGTGAGLPGLPLAIADAATDWLLVDRSARKVRFIERVVGELALANVSALSLDLDGSLPEALRGRSDVIVSRAMAAPAALIGRTSALLASAGTYVLMTGAGGVSVSDAELAGTGFGIVARQPVNVPGLDRVHEVTIIRRDTACRGSFRT